MFIHTQVMSAAVMGKPAGWRGMAALTVYTVALGRLPEFCLRLVALPEPSLAARGAEPGGKGREWPNEVLLHAALLLAVVVRDFDAAVAVSQSDGPD